MAPPIDSHTVADRLIHYYCLSRRDNRTENAQMEPSNSGVQYNANVVECIVSEWVENS